MSQENQQVNENEKVQETQEVELPVSNTEDKPKESGCCGACGG
ncbi:hypothetical protein QG082_07025 [Kingella kingae]|nr:hypothetical protein [Kingella kingae]MDK4528743.1 hypothetical protein [Kingella kingae]MDK4543269.1 hypothetical protein [Kingella kingae]MDK4562718.1 hypothetical protein [Kingella kingae]MDK4564804.1 hypothetical protein [Kingella kingae]MDK4576446.1 hypothetical protein [Kingella kingae]